MKKLKLNYTKIYIYLLVVIVAMLLIFFWAAGEQLFYRDSVGEIAENIGNCVSDELVAGNIVDQYFYADMDRIEKMGVLLTSNGKEILSDVTVVLEDYDAKEILAQITVPAEDIGVNEYVYLDLGEGLVGYRNKLLKLSYYSEDGQAGNSASGVYDNSVINEGEDLWINREIVKGTMSYMIEGSDDVWTGSVYPYIAIGVVALITLLYAICAYRHEKGKREFIFETYFVLKRYQFLIEQIVNRDFKVKYKRSMLGVFWSFLNPLLTMVVQYIIFSQLFRGDIENFPVYLLSGTVVFNFFSEAVGLSLTSITGNAALITKVYVPKYIYPVTRVLSSMINLLISMIPLACAVLITGEEFTKAFLLIPIILICVLVFTIGIGMLLSALMVFFRDIQFLWGIISMLWMYATPLFYPESIIPEHFKFVHVVNPMYYYVKAFRMIVLDGISPEPKMYVLCALMALGSFVIGATVFKKTQDSFALNI